MSTQSVLYENLIERYYLVQRHLLSQHQVINSKTVILATEEMITATIQVISATTNVILATEKVIPGATKITLTTNNLMSVPKSVRQFYAQARTLSNKLNKIEIGY